MRVSVAMCTYNGSQYLREQLASIEQQKRRPDQLVVVDDGSTDATDGIVSEFVNSSRIAVRFIRNDERLGVTRNFEKALLATDGDIVFLADQDDIWRPHKIERIVEYMTQDSSSNVVFSNGDCIDSLGRPIGFTLWDKCGRSHIKHLASGRTSQVLSLLKRDLVTGATMAVRRRFLDSALPIHPTWVHDGWLACIAGCQNSLVAIDDPLIEYRVHSKQEVGVAASSLGARIQRQRLRHRENDLQRFKALESKMNGTLSPEIQVALRSKIEHLERRATLSSSLLRRISQISSEAFAGRYHRFSSGLNSILVDILR